MPVIHQPHPRRQRVSGIHNQIYLALTFLLVITLSNTCGHAAQLPNHLSNAFQRPSRPSDTARRARNTVVPIFRGGSSSEGAGPLKVFVDTIKEARSHLAAAGVARCVSIFAMFPVDTIKTRMQMEQANPLKLAGIYKGVSGSLVGQVPYGVLTFGSYEMYKKALLAKCPKVKPVFLFALAAVMGDLTGSGYLCPSEVVKQQMQAGMYASQGEAIRSIWKTKGLGGFYQGYLGGVARDVPFRVVQLTSFEVTKNLFLSAKTRREQTNEKIELSPVESAVCGAISGTFSAAITNPLDRIKTILMTGNGAYGDTVKSCITKIWKDEGARGFTVGIVPRIVYIAPSVVIFFVAYEQTRQRLFPAE